MEKIIKISLVILMCYVGVNAQCELYKGPKTTLYLDRTKNLACIETVNRVVVAKYTKNPISSFYKMNYNAFCIKKKKRLSLESYSSTSDSSVIINITYYPSNGFFINYDQGVVTINGKENKLLNYVKMKFDSLANFSTIPLYIKDKDSLLIGRIELKTKSQAIKLKLKGTRTILLNKKNSNVYHLNYYYPWWNDNKWIGQRYLSKFKINDANQIIILDSNEILEKEEDCDGTIINSSLSELSFFVL